MKKTLGDLPHLNLLTIAGAEAGRLLGCSPCSKEDASSTDELLQLAVRIQWDALHTGQYYDAIAAQPWNKVIPVKLPDTPQRIVVEEV